MSVIYQNGTYYGISSPDAMPAEDMSEVVSPLPGVTSRKMKYSTEEQVVGEWIDGKPLYQKTFYSNSITTSPYSFGDVSNFNILHIYGTAFLSKNNNSAGIITIPGTYSTSSDSIEINIKTNYAKTAIVIYYSGNISIDEVYVTIQYTKTTD